MTTGSIIVTRGLKRLANLANIGSNFLELNGKLTYDQWAGLGPILGAMHGASRWWVGDWIRHGEAAYGEKYVQLRGVNSWRWLTPWKTWSESLGQTQHPEIVNSHCY